MHRTVNPSGVSTSRGGVIGAPSSARGRRAAHESQDSTGAGAAGMPSQASVAPALGSGTGEVSASPRACRWSGTSRARWTRRPSQGGMGSWSRQSPAWALRASASAAASRWSADPTADHRPGGRHGASGARDRRRRRRQARRGPRVVRGPRPGRGCLLGLRLPRPAPEAAPPQLAPAGLHHQLRPRRPHPAAAPLTATARDPMIGSAA